MKAPNFWCKKFSLLSLLLLPFSGLFYLITKFRQLYANPQKVNATVICIGNFNIGGSGKTPVAITLAQLLINKGKKVAFISRGYKAQYTEITKVNLTNHSADEVGDEPLLLAQYADTWIGKNRYTTAQKALQYAKYQYLLLDDGLQNYALYYDLKICVINSNYHGTNNLLLPAGPLRQTWRNGIKNTHLFIVIDANNNTKINGPIIMGQQILNEKNIKALCNKPLLAFAGLGYPDKFFTSLKECNLNVKETVFFPDHYAYLDIDIKKLLQQAHKEGLTLVTTAKDYVKIPVKYKNYITCVEMNVHLDITAEHLAKIMFPQNK